MIPTVDSITEELRVCNERARELERDLAHAIYKELSPTDALNIGMLSTTRNIDLTPGLIEKAYRYPKLFNVDKRDTGVQIELTSLGLLVSKVLNVSSRHLNRHADTMITYANDLESKLEDIVSQIILNVRVYPRQASAIQLLADDEINPDADVNLLYFISGYYDHRTYQITPLGRLVYSEVIKALAVYGLDLNKLAGD